MPEQVLDTEKSETAICFLIINRIEELPRVAIQSALNQTTAHIYVGYINDLDITEIPKDKRIKFVQLSSDDLLLSEISTNYQSFGSENFYHLVQLKWPLLNKVSGLGYKYIIYSDIDVVWVGDAAKGIEKTFELFEQAHILVQSFTRSPNDALLCMGIFAFRDSLVSMNFIDMCKNAHSAAVHAKESIGDDEIVTTMYRKLGFPEYLRELPQSTFAVGNFLDLFSTKAKIPGVHKPIPLIFHCNYVVGLRNKRLMLRIFLSRSQRKELNIRFGLKFRVILFTKHLRSIRILKPLNKISGNR